MKYLITTIAALVLVGCKTVKPAAEATDHSGTYILSNADKDIITLDLKTDGSFTGMPKGQEDDRAIGSWKVEGELLICEGTTEKSSKIIVFKFNKTTKKLISLSADGKEMPLENEIPEGEDGLYLKELSKAESQLTENEDSEFEKNFQRVTSQLTEIDSEFEKNFQRVTAEMEKRDESLSEASRGLLDAVDKGNIEEVKRQLASGADVNAHGAVGFPINQATQFGHKAIIELLISKGADVNVKDIQGFTPLHRVAFDGHVKMAELLIEKGAELNVKNGWHSTPLVEAALGNQLELVKLLISKGADVNLVDNRNQTALDRVSGPVGTGNKEIADLLRKHGGKTGEELKAELPKLEIEQSLLQAIKAGNIEAVKQHLEAGTDVNASDNLGRTALHKASGWQGQSEIVELLISNGADVNAKRSDGAIPLHYAVYYNRMENAEILLSNGADLNAKDGDQNGATPLHEAAWRSRKEIVDLLISKGADVNDKDNEGQTPLDLAVQHKSSENIKLLRKHGAKTGEELKAEGK